MLAGGCQVEILKIATLLTYGTYSVEFLPCIYFFFYISSFLPSYLYYILLFFVPRKKSYTVYVVYEKTGVFENRERVTPRMGEFGRSGGRRVKLESPLIVKK